MMDVQHTTQTLNPIMGAEEPMFVGVSPTIVGRVNVSSATRTRQLTS